MLLIVRDRRQEEIAMQSARADPTEGIRSTVSACIGSERMQVARIPPTRRLAGSVRRRLERAGVKVILRVVRLLDTVVG